MKAVLVLVLFSSETSVGSDVLRKTNEHAESREWDIVLYGATGFTGKLALQYLRQLPEVRRWALAGRNMTTLKALHEEAELGEDVDSIAADLSDTRALQALTERAWVIVSAAGPYSEYHGENLIRACIRSGTHYADLSGETFWQQRIIQELHEPAKQARVKIVLGAGYDSVPSDLSVILSAQNLTATPSKVMVVHTRCNTYYSGGTLASAAAAERDARDRVSANDNPVTNDPYALAPDVPFTFRVDKHSTNIHRRHFDSEFNEDIEPFAMGTVNAAIVRRSLSLLFPNVSCSYSEGLASPALEELAAFRNRKGVPPINLKPKRGEGPPDWVLKDGSFALEAHAIAQNGSRVIVKIAGRGDPGYAGSAKMLVETGIGLVHSHVQMYGVLTPSTALGLELVQRLQAAQQGKFMQFEVSHAKARAGIASEASRTHGRDRKGERHTMRNIRIGPGGEIAQA